MLEEILKNIKNELLSCIAEKCLEEHKDCLEHNIREAIEAGMPADKVAEIAFKVGYVHGVNDFVEHIEEDE